MEEIDNSVAEECQAEEIVGDVALNEDALQCQETSVDIEKEELEAENTCPEETTESIQDECDEKQSCSVGDVLESIEGLSEKIEQMNQLFVQKIQHTTHEEKIVDQMHAELQRYKEDIYSQLVRPILLDIIEVRDSILRMSSNYASRPEGEQDIPLKTFSDYALDIQDILEKNNISIYGSKEGDDFTPIKQRVVKKIPTPVEELHGKVAESLSSGYDYLGKTICPEKIVIYVYQKQEDSEGESK